MCAVKRKRNAGGGRMFLAMCRGSRAIVATQVRDFPWPCENFRRPPYKVCGRDASLSGVAVIERMSGGERLWYRVGARMARRVEASRGRNAMIELALHGDRLVSTYRQIVGRQPAGR